MKFLLVAGARPNFMKIAPIVRALTSRPHAGIRTSRPLEGGGQGGGGSSFNHTWKLVHTGQHHDHGMSKVFFDELEIPEPDFHLECGSGSHAEQTARVMVAFEKVCLGCVLYSSSPRRAASPTCAARGTATGISTSSAT